ncbi:MAG TPA: AAA family ATPase, partial [Nannocystis sp.]
MSGALGSSIFARNFAPGGDQGAAFERTLLAQPPLGAETARDGVRAEDTETGREEVAVGARGSGDGARLAGAETGRDGVAGSREGEGGADADSRNGVLLAEAETGGRDGEVSGREGAEVVGSRAAASLFPPSWRLPHDAAGFRPLLGAGLGLVRVRELPLVGREDERDRLWEALGRVHAEGRPRLVLVRGPSGVGKSRLVEWTAARAHELGAAEVLRAAHGPFGGPAEGLSRMLAAHLRCVGLPGDEVFARCLAAIDPSGRGGGQARLEAAALTDLLCPGDVGAGRPRVRLQDARERHHVLAAQLSRIAAACPLFVWIDDAQWGAPALEFVRHCLQPGRGPRALFVATIRDDLLAERPVEAALVAALAELPICETLSIAPLPEDQHRELIEELLGIERGLVDAIVARTAGNPLFTVELVGDWIARGLLRPGRGGFTLRAEAAVDLPDDLHALWRRRIEGLLERRFAEPTRAAARAALELAAAIGQEIDAAAWARACALAGIEAPAELGLVLVRERLAVATATGFAFVHGMLRESLERMAAEAGRAAGHHRVCAALLRELGANRAGAPWEIARHLIAAGELAAALGPLLQASYELQLAGEYRAAAGALDQHVAVADRLGLPPHDRERLRGRMQRAWLSWMRGGAEAGTAGGRGSGPDDRGAAEVEAIAALARAHGHDEVLGEALRWRGLVARFDRRFAESLAALAEAAACFERAGDGEGQARTALAQAVTLRALGRTDEAEARLRTAEALARARGLAVLLPRILGNLAEIALQRRDWPEAQVRFARAIEAAEQVGDRKALALTAGGAGDLAFVRDDFAAAEAHYRRAEALLAALGSRYLGGIRLHLAALDALRGQASAAAALQAATTGDDPLQAALGHLALAATSQERAALAEHLRGAAEQLARAGEVRPVLARLSERVRENAHHCG